MPRFFIFDAATETPLAIVDAAELGEASAMAERHCRQLERQHGRNPGRRGPFRFRYTGELSRSDCRQDLVAEQDRWREALARAHAARCDLFGRPLPAEQLGLL